MRAHDVAQQDVLHRAVPAPSHADRVAPGGAQDAVVHQHALAGAGLLHLLLVAANDERVVLRIDDAVAHHHVAAAAEVESVAVREAVVAFDPRAAHAHAVAVQEPVRPSAGVADEDVVEAHVPAGDEEHAPARHVRVAVAPPVVAGPVLLRLPVVELLVVAVDRAGAGDGDVRLGDGVEHRAVVEAQGALGVPVLGMAEERVLERILAAEERRAAVDVQIDVVLEAERVRHVRAAARHEDAPAALGGAVVDRLLDGGGVVRHAVRLRAVGGHVERSRRRGRGTRREHRGNRRERDSVSFHFSPVLLQRVSDCHLTLLVRYYATTKQCCHGSHASSIFVRRTYCPFSCNRPRSRG